MNTPDTSARVWIPQPDDYNALAERIEAANNKRDTRVVIYKNGLPFDTVDIGEFVEQDYFDEILELMGEDSLDYTEHAEDRRVHAARLVC